MKFKTLGIHTRLYYIVKRAGGIDMKARRQYFKSKFGLDDSTIDVVIKYNLDDLLKKHTIDEIIAYELEERKRKKAELEKANKEISYIVNTLASKMFMGGRHLL